MAAGGGRRRRTTTKSTGTPPTTSKSKATKPQSNKKYIHQHTEQLLNLLTTTTASTLSFLSQNDTFLNPSQTQTLQSLLLSTSISLSSLHSLLPSSTKPLSFPSLKLSSLCFFHRFLSSVTSEDDPRWVENFHLSKSSFSLLLRLLSPSLQSAFPSFPPSYTLASALFRLAHAVTYKSVGKRFSMDSKDACRAFYVVCKVIHDKLGSLFELSSDVNRVLNGFKWMSLPNCCGVLGFDRFKIDDGDMLGEKGALLVQGLVDSEGRFLDVSAGWPSSMLPSTILRQTKLFTGVEESMELLNGPSCELKDGSLIPQYVLGESCFPLSSWLLTPYIRSEDEEDSFSSKERVFNKEHEKAMKLVRMAFGRVRARWKLLSRTWKEECIEFFPFVMVAGCLLHNFLIKCGEEFPEEFVVECIKKDELPVFEGEVDESGLSIRDVLAFHLNQYKSPPGISHVQSCMYVIPIAFESKDSVSPSWGASHGIFDHTMNFCHLPPTPPSSQASNI